jgi:hypothetical protein
MTNETYPKYVWKEVILDREWSFMRREERFARLEWVASVQRIDRWEYRVHVGSGFEHFGLLPKYPYIERKKYLSLDAAKLAVEKKLPNLYETLLLVWRLQRER